MRGRITATSLHAGEALAPCDRRETKTEITVTLDSFVSQIGECSWTSSRDICFASTAASGQSASGNMPGRYWLVLRYALIKIGGRAGKLLTLS